VEPTVRNSKGSRVFRKECTVDSPASLRLIEGKIPLDDMAAGDYAVTARVISRGHPAVDFTQILQKLPPNSNEVKIDRFSRLLLVNGKPFIPIINEVMFWGRKLAGQDVPDNGLEVFARDSGLQSVILWGSTPFSPQNVTDCSALGLKIILFMQSEMEKAMRAGGQEDVTKRLEEIFAQYRDEPNLLAWFLADEGNLFADEKYFKERYARLKKADPYHPIFRNEGAWAVGCGGAGGLVTTEIYCGGYGGYKLIEAINIDAVPQGVPSMSLTAWFGPPEHASYPTPAQTVARAYENFIHGACGLFVWGVHGGKPPVPALWDAMMKIRKEMDVLTPVFAKEAIREGVISSNPSVHCTTRVCNGTRYLISVNVGDKEQAVVFSFPQILQCGSAVNILFDGGTEKIVDWKLNTVFKPYQRRVYTW